MDREQALEIYKMIAREKRQEYRLKNIEKIRERDRERKRKYRAEIREKLREYEQMKKGGSNNE